mgnify:CR=1 FL=1
MEQNRLIGTNNFNTHYYIPFLKEPQTEQQPKKKKEKREKSLYNNWVQ